MTGALTIRVGTVRSRLEAPRDILLALDEALAVEVPGAHFARRNSPGWDGKWHPFNALNGAFPSGLLSLVRKALPSAHVADEREFPPSYDPRPEMLRGVTLAPHQLDAIRKGLAGRNGILAVGVGGGKTEVGIALAECVRGRAVWVVHRKDLLHQTAERIRARTGTEPDLVGDGAWTHDPARKFAVVMPQTALKDIDLARAENGNASVLILDEVHRTGASIAYFRLAQAIPAPYRIGLTGSPDTGDPVRDLRLQAATGPILLRVRTSELARIGWSAPCRVVYHRVAHPEVPGDYRTVRRICIEEAPYRNVHVVDLAEKAARDGEPCLVICDTVRHVRRIADVLASRSVRFRVLTGATASGSRAEARRDIGTGALEVILATPIFDEGIDLPVLKVVILAAGGKSAVRVLQRIGRVLRRAPGKERATVHDFLDVGNRYLLRHAQARLATCRREGFEIADATGAGRPGAACTGNFPRGGYL